MTRTLTRMPETPATLEPVINPNVAFGREARDFTLGVPRPAPIGDAQPVRLEEPTGWLNDAIPAPSELVVAKRFAWSLGSTEFSEVFEKGEKVRVGQVVGTTRLTAEHFAHLLASGFADNHDVCTVRCISWTVAVGDQRYGPARGKLLAVTRHEAAYMCNIPPHQGGPTAVHVCPGVYNGPMDQLPPIPPSRFSAQPEPPRPAVRFVKFRYSEPPEGSDARRGDVGWMVEDQAVGLHLTGRGEIDEDLEALSSAWRTKLEAGMKDRVPLGQAYMVRDGKILPPLGKF
jgi:hypothetical protein